MSATIHRLPARPGIRRDPRVLALVADEWRCVQGRWFPPDTPVDAATTWPDLIRHSYSLADAYAALTGAHSDSEGAGPWPA